MNAAEATKSATVRPRAATNAAIASCFKPMRSGSGRPTLSASQPRAVIPLTLPTTSDARMIHVIMPQALKRTLPPLAGQFISLIKDSSLVSVIAITDLTKSGREVITSTFATFEIWFVVALLYLVNGGEMAVD